MCVYSVCVCVCLCARARARVCVVCVCVTVSQGRPPPLSHTPPELCQLRREGRGNGRECGVGGLKRVSLWRSTNPWETLISYLHPSPLFCLHVLIIFFSMVRSAPPVSSQSPYMPALSRLLDVHWPLPCY